MTFDDMNLFSVIKPYFPMFAMVRRNVFSDFIGRYGWTHGCSTFQFQQQQVLVVDAACTSLLVL